MLKKINAKIALLIAVVVIGMGVMGTVLWNMQGAMSLQSYQNEMQSEGAALPEQLQSADDATTQNTQTFDAVYQSKAQSIAYMANNGAGFEETDAKMAEYKKLLGVDNVIVVKRDGSITAKAQDTKANFSSTRFNQLRTVFDDGKPSEAVDIELKDQGWDMRYYAARVDNDTMVVIEQNPAELDSLVDDSGSIASAVKNIAIGQSGFVIAISALDYTVSYHPDDRLVGTDAISDGVSVADLESGTFSWMTIDDQSLYCYTVQVDNTYYLLAVPESDMASSRNVTVGVTLFAFFAVMLLVAVYGVLVTRDQERRGSEEGAFAKVGSKWVFNKAIARKAAILTLVGFIGVVVVAFYMQTLFALSSETMTNRERVTEVQQTIERTTDQADALSVQNSERNLSKAETAAYVLDHNGALENRTNLQQLADVLEIEDVYVFDNSGTMTSTSAPYSDFVLSDDPNDQSYEFRKLLQGVDHVVQDPQTDDATGELRQYIGVCLYDSTGAANGFVQTAIHPSRLEALLDSVKIENVLPSVKVGTDGFAFAINKSDNTFAYYPDSRYQGKDALASGMTASQIKGGFNDYVTIGDKTYYASSIDTDDYYLYAAGSEGELMAERGPLTAATAIVSLICQILVFLLLTFSRAGHETVRADSGAGAGEEDARVVNVALPSGRVVRTESAAGRWLPRALGWEEKSPEQKLATVMKALVAIMVVAVFIAVMFRDAIFGSDSLFSYILGGEWERGLNVFAITASLMFVCVAMTVATLVQKLLSLLATVLGARGETVCRLLGSFIKYATIIGMVYYCLALLGVDTTTLLASAGILSIAISFGAKELVSDILSGLFVIFEGEFRVGDIITVGTWTGTVVEIGVRTTKVQDGNGNVKVIRNSEISNVVNMTKELSYASCDVGIEYSESLERVESILHKELPNIRKRLPAILDGPFYKGVVALEDSSVVIRIVVQCRESDRAQLTRDLNRQMKLLFDKYNIAIPFPQVVVNQPLEAIQATEEEKRAAEAFNEEQKNAAAAKNLGNDERDKD